MPFFPALPEYRPATVRPFSALIGGMGAASEMMGQSAKAGLQREALTRARGEREALASGDMDKLRAAAPETYLKLNAQDQEVAANALADINSAGTRWTPENYPQQYQALQDKYKRHPLITGGLPKPEQMQTQEQINEWLKRPAALQQQIEQSGLRGKGQVIHELEKDKYRDITEPAMKLEMGFKEKIAGMQIKSHEGIAEAQRKLDEELTGKKLKLEEEIKKDVNLRNREKIVLDNAEKEDTALNGRYMIARKDIEDNFRGVARDQKLAELEEVREYLQNEINRKYDQIAKKYGIDFGRDVKDIPKPGALSRPVGPGAARPGGPTSANADAIAEARRRGLIK